MLLCEKGLMRMITINLKLLVGIIHHSSPCFLLYEIVQNNDSRLKSHHIGHFSLDKLALGPSSCLKANNLKPRPICDNVARILENRQDWVLCIYV